MSAKVIELPERVRCDRAARELREGVIGVLTRFTAKEAMPHSTEQPVISWPRSRQ
jgi:hypothetical protein